MAHIAKFQSDYNRNAKSSNLFKAPKIMIKEKERTNIWEDNIIDWCTYYRRNIHRFVEHYFQINLHWYQIIWIYFMSICDSFITIASRASAKSWLIAVLALARGVLYPGSEVVVVAATQKQAAIIFGKIGDLKDKYININREISDYVSGQLWICKLHNTSTIKVVACGESGRGTRCTFLIGEEFRIMNKSKFDSIARPFAYVRQTPYLANPKYSHLKEEPVEILISSAYHKGEWWYKETATTIRMMAKGKNVGFIAFDYLIAIRHGIKTKKVIDKERELMDEITFMEEYENIPWGESSDAYYKLAMFKKNQNIKMAFYPQRDDTFNEKKNPYGIAKFDGEIRIVSVDIATRKGNGNDNTVISCTRLSPTHEGYHRDVCYIETHNGENTIIQSKRIKQVFYDFESDYLVLDIQNAGITIYDMLGQVTKDEDRGIEYPAWTVMQHESLEDKTYDELYKRTLSLNALPVVYPISGSAKRNNDIAVEFRNKLQRKLISFLIPEQEAEEYLIKKKKDYLKYSDNFSERAWYLHPYRQTSELVNESVALSMKLISGNIKLEEPNGARKDRYISVAYMNYFATFLDKNILKEKNDDGDMSDILACMSW